MTSREWAELVKPVLPHVATDKDFPELGIVRIEVGHQALYAIATDRYTLAAERRPLARIDRGQPQPPVHIRASDVRSSLGLFAFAKDSDPPLTVTVDTVSVPSEVLGEPGHYTSMAVTLTSGDGGRMVMHDRRDAHRDPLAKWQPHVSAAVGRQQGASPAGLDLAAAHLARWKDAVRAGERLTFWTGSRRKDPLLVTVESHFAGIWVPELWGTDGEAPPDPAGPPWLAELDGADPVTGEKQ